MDATSGDGEVGGQVCEIVDVPLSCCYWGIVVMEILL